MRYLMLSLLTNFKEYWRMFEQIQIEKCHTLHVLIRALTLCLHDSVILVLTIIS